MAGIYPGRHHNRSFWACDFRSIYHRLIGQICTRRVDLHAQMARWGDAVETPLLRPLAIGRLSAPIPRGVGMARPRHFPPAGACIACEQRGE